MSQFWARRGRFKGSPAVRTSRGPLGHSCGAGGSQLSWLAVPMLMLLHAGAVAAAH